MSDLFNKIKTVTELDGIAGYEHNIRNFLRQEITPLVDQVETDGLGGILELKILMRLMLLKSWLLPIWMKSALWLVIFSQMEHFVYLRLEDGIPSSQLTTLYPLHTFW